VRLRPLHRCFDGGFDLDGREDQSAFIDDRLLVQLGDDLALAELRGGDYGL